MAPDTAASAERFYNDFAEKARQNPVISVDSDPLQDFRQLVREVVEGSESNEMLTEIQAITNRMDKEDLHVSNGDIHVLSGLLCENAGSGFDLYGNVRRFQDDMMVFSYPDPNVQATRIVLEIFDFLFAAFKSMVSGTDDIELQESLPKLQASRENVRTFTDLGVDNGILLGLVEHYQRLGEDGD
jgi:hypothetical protein